MTSEDLQLPARRIFSIRLAIGLVQGGALYVLIRWFDGLPLPVFNALFLALMLAPVVALGSLGALRPRTFWTWLGVATLIAGALGAYDVFAKGETTKFASAPVYVPAAAIVVFILHELIAAADADRRWRAGYERYFDDGWKDAIRLALAALFVGALWLLLVLGAQLFSLIGLEFLRRLIERPWFAIPVTTSFLAIAVHLTDVRASLVRGARTLALSLLSWLLPVLAGLTAAFLLALPFTGLAPLWETRSATGILLAVSAALIILINAAYQDGERADFPPGALKWSARVAGVALAPLVVIAGYGLALRIGQYGLSPARVYAAACVAVAACYAAGYLWAATSRGAWMKPLETTNWLTAHVVVAVLLLLFSPVADPARIAVDDQLRRLAAGRVSPQQFDYAFLRFRSGRWGQAALKELAAGRGEVRSAPVVRLAQEQLRVRNAWGRPAATPEDRRAYLHPVGGALPAGFLDQAWASEDDPAEFCRRQPDPCEVVTAELDAAPGAEVIVFSAVRTRVYARREGRWTSVGALTGGGLCPEEREALRQGRFRPVPPAARADIEINGRRRVFAEETTCAPPREAEAKAGRAN